MFVELARPIYVKPIKSNELKLSTLFISQRNWATSHIISLIWLLFHRVKWKIFIFHEWRNSTFDRKFFMKTVETNDQTPHKTSFMIWAKTFSARPSDAVRRAPFLP